LFAKSLGVYALAIGLLAGSVLQVALQLPGIRDTKLSLVVDWHHPAIRRIAKLYVPIALGLVVDMISRGVSYRLASATGDQSIAWMDYATTIMQFPLGLTSTAISIAILPTLARQANWKNPSDNKAFLKTLSHAIRLVMVLIVPATIGLLVLARPVVELILEHGDFLPKDTDMTTYVLRLYLVGIIAAALDLPLVNAFYARQEAWTPALVGVVGVVVYLAAALLPSIYRPMQLGDLIIANAIQLCYHAVSMYILLQRRVGSMRGHRLMFTATRATLAAIMMGFVIAGTLWCTTQVSWPNPVVSELVSVLIPGTTGIICYITFMNLMKVPELAQLFQLIKPVTKHKTN
jgi:putative peptidoglycan lipid II flippase